ncbi:MAG: hypothetical protein ACC661_08250, partial [Verrucomicrobiales bacterium]
PEIAIPKTGIAFTLGTAPHDLLGLRVWGAKAHPGWKKARKSVLGLRPVDYEPHAHPEAGMNLLFVGNSFTARHNLAGIVGQLALAGDPDCGYRATKIIYGGQKLEAHWKLRSQNWVKAPGLTPGEQESTVAEMSAELAGRAKDKLFVSALQRQKRLLGLVREGGIEKWDLVSLQSWPDKEGGLDSLYAEYARKFAKIARAQGARPILYETTPATQNAEALETPPDAAPALANARWLKQLGEELDALVVPMSLVANECQRARPDLTMRYVNDAHPNQVMAYLTACTFYSVLFERSPEGLPVNSVSDTKIVDPDHPELDPDGGPIKKILPEDLRNFLQRTAWEAVQKFNDLE